MNVHCRLRGRGLACAWLPAVLAGVIVGWHSIPAMAEVHHVDMRNDQFVPLLISIAPGDSIHWTNDETPEDGGDLELWRHTVTSGFDCVADGLFGSGVLEPDQEFGWRFAEEGEFHYFCERKCERAGMTAVVVVGSPVPTREVSWGQIRSIYR